MKFVILSRTLLCFYLSVDGQAKEIPWKIDEKTAHILTAEAHDGGMDLWQAYDYDDGNRMSPGFFAYTELGLEADNVGVFAVNPWTGDVWSLWECKKISTPASRAIQKEIRKRFTLEELYQYKRLGRIKPSCS